MIAASAGAAASIALLSKTKTKTIKYPDDYTERLKSRQLITLEEVRARWKVLEEQGWKNPYADIIK